MDIFRTNPEVTISKTSSPRLPYNDQNPLSSLVEVAVQQPKLPDLKDKDRAAAVLMHGSQIRQQPYDRQVYDNSRYPGASPSSVPPSVGQAIAVSPSGAVPAAAAGAVKPTNLVQQVKTERAKQMYLMQDKERIERDFPAAAAAVASALPPNPTTSKPLPVPKTSTASTSTLPTSSKDIGDMGRDRTLTAASLIDAIITHSINSGTCTESSTLPPQGKQGFRKSPAELAAMTPQEEAKVFGATVTSGAAATTAIAAASGVGSYQSGRVDNKSPTVKAELVNGPDEAHSTPGSSRPASRSSSAIPTTVAVTETEADADQHWKRRNQSLPPATTSQSAGGSQSTSVTAIAPTSVASSSETVAAAGDERQITRVATEPISPPPTSEGVLSEANSGGANGSKKFSKASNPGVENASNSKAGIVDYVKNKIVEEMRKEPHQQSPVVAGATASLGTSGSAAPVEARKRLADTGSCNRDPGDTSTKNESESRITPSPPKKPLLSDNQPVGITSAPPDSPGSEGEMVIDESDRPDSAGGGESQPPVQSKVGPTTPATTASPASITSSTPVTADGGAKGSENPSSVASSGPVAPQPPVTQPRYEPLSDDD